MSETNFFDLDALLLADQSLTAAFFLNKTRQERVEDGPPNAEHRSLVAEGEIASDKQTYERSLGPDIAKGVDHWPARSGRVVGLCRGGHMWSQEQMIG